MAADHDPAVFRQLENRRRLALDLLRREAAVGTEWTSDGCGYSVAVVQDIDDPDLLRLVWYDERGPSGHTTKPFSEVAEEIVGHFGGGIRRCDGDLQKVMRRIAEGGTFHGGPY